MREQGSWRSRGGPNWKRERERKGEICGVELLQLRYSFIPGSHYKKDKLQDESDFEKHCCPGRFRLSEAGSLGRGFSCYPAGGTVCAFKHPLRDNWSCNAVLTLSPCVFKACFDHVSFDILQTTDIFWFRSQRFTKCLLLLQPLNLFHIMFYYKPTNLYVSKTNTHQYVIIKQK